MEECYVCYEPCSTPAQCKCKNLYVHSSCITIMKIYGKDRCTICKEPYHGVQYVTEEVVLPLAPRYCFFIPTLLRCGNYRMESTDIIMDPLRYVVWALICVVVHRAIINDWMGDFGVDVLYSFFGLIILSFVCSVYRRKATTTTRMIDQPERHVPVAV